MANDKEMRLKVSAISLSGRTTISWQNAENIGKVLDDEIKNYFRMNRWAAEIRIEEA